MKLSKYTEKLFRIHLELKKSNSAFFLKAFFRKMKITIRFIENLIFYFKIRKYKETKKIIYAISPPPSLRNVGDQAQALAIKKWFRDYFKEYLLFEFDKEQVYLYMPVIKKIVNNNDIIFLHSGGNLNNRSPWSEEARRLIIKELKENRIISLPQTIYFDKTEEGIEQLEKTKLIYNKHKNLTIMARDHKSFTFAKEYFPECKTMLCPDFVLYLETGESGIKKTEKVLLCLRNDYESVLNKNTKNLIKKYIWSLNKEFTEYDTTLSKNILRKNREKELEKTLLLFKKHKLVITDRLHGIIFSAIAKTPCIALKTVDHKLTESIKWFNDLNFIFYIGEDFRRLPETIKKALNLKHLNCKNWKKTYFEDLKSKIL